MATCPHCGYEGEATDFTFESVRVDDPRNPERDRGTVCCPSCGAVLGGYTFRDTTE